MSQDKKLKDLLFEARWGVKAGKNDFAYDKLTDALEEIGALPNIEDQEPPSMGDLPEEKEITGYVEPTFVKVPGVSYKESRYVNASKMADGLVTHYTVSGRTKASALGVLKYMASKNLGCMVMDEDGIIYVPENFDPMKDAAAHAGVSAWMGRSSLNNKFAGVEICNWGRTDKEDAKYGRTRQIVKQAGNMIPGWYQPYTEKQEEALKNLCIWMKKQNPSFDYNNVIGHDEARAAAGKPGDKQDPGGALSVTMGEFRAMLQKIS